MHLPSNRTQQARRTSGATTRTTARSGARIARVIALCGVVGLFACEDATAPEATSADLRGLSLTVVQTTPLGMIGETLVDATSWVLSSINNLSKRAEMKYTLMALADHLMTGAFDASRADVTKARAVRASLNAEDAVEIGPIEVSLDETDMELKAIGK